MVSQIPLTTNEEFKSAVSAAKKAFPSWKNTPITTRQRVMLKYQDLIRKNMVSVVIDLKCFNVGNRNSFFSHLMICVDWSYHNVCCRIS